MPKTTNDTPETITLVVLGRPEGGVLDPETGQRAPGGVAWSSGGEDFRAEPGDEITVPVRVGGSLLADSICVTPEDAEGIAAAVELQRAAAIAAQEARGTGYVDPADELPPAPSFDSTVGEPVPLPDGSFLSPPPVEVN